MKKSVIFLIIFAVIIIGGSTYYKYYATNNKSNNDNDIPQTNNVATSSDSITNKKEEEDTSNYQSKESIFASYTNQNASYISVDIDNDGKEDLVIAAGANEAAKTIYIYKKMNDFNYLYVGKEGLGHSSLYKEENTNFLTIQYGQMGHEIIYHVSIINNEAKMETIKETDLKEGEEYDSFTGELVFSNIE